MSPVLLIVNILLWEQKHYGTILYLNVAWTNNTFLPICPISWFLLLRVTDFIMLYTYYMRFVILNKSGMPAKMIVKIYLKQVLLALYLKEFDQAMKQYTKWNVQYLCRTNAGRNIVNYIFALRHTLQLLGQRHWWYNNTFVAWTDMVPSLTV